jgi:hypothetical protein
MFLTQQPVSGRRGGATGKGNLGAIAAGQNQIDLGGKHLGCLLGQLLWGFDNS